MYICSSYMCIQPLAFWFVWIIMKIEYVNTKWLFEIWNSYLPFIELTERWSFVYKLVMKITFLLNFYIAKCFHFLKLVAMSINSIILQYTNVWILSYVTCVLFTNKQTLILHRIKCILLAFWTDSEVRMWLIYNYSTYIMLL